MKLSSHYAYFTQAVEEFAKHCRPSRPHLDLWIDRLDLPRIVDREFVDLTEHTERSIQHHLIRAAYELVNDARRASDETVNEFTHRFQFIGLLHQLLTIIPAPESSKLRSHLKLDHANEYADTYARQVKPSAYYANELLNHMNRAVLTYVHSVLAKDATVEVPDYILAGGDEWNMLGYLNSYSATGSPRSPNDTSLHVPSDAQVSPSETGYLPGSSSGSA
jgi:hypothetical protein